MQAKLRTVDSSAQVSYASKTGRIQVVMSSGLQIKVISDEELTKPAFLAEWGVYNPTAFYGPENPRSINEVIPAQPSPMASSYLSQLIQTQPF